MEHTLELPLLNNQQMVEAFLLHTLFSANSLIKEIVSSATLVLRDVPWICASNTFERAPDATGATSLVAP